MRKHCFIIALVFVGLQLKAQNADTSVFKYPLQMDAVVVTAARAGWDVAAFIRRVQTDTTFYKSFRALHLVSFSAVNDIRVYDKNDKIIASLYSHTKQTEQQHCRSMAVLDETTTGNFYEHGRDYTYYTAALYAYLFFTQGTICNEDDIVAGKLNEKGKGQLEKNKAELKQLIFNPGGHITGVPFMGDKAAIFEPDVARHYDFQLSSDEYNGEDCYVFKAIPKKGEEGDVVYNELATWFRKSDYAIVARDYALSYHTLFYDFDVRMKVRTQQVNKRLLPISIDYDGNWHVFTRKRERVKFSARFTY